MNSVFRRVNDVDSHEQIPFARWPEAFGDAVEEVRFIMNSCPLPSLNAPANDELPISDENVWTVTGGAAPGAGDMARLIALVDPIDRTSVVTGRRGSVRVDIGGGRRKQN